MKLALAFSALILFGCGGGGGSSSSSQIVTPPPPNPVSATLSYAGSPAILNKSQMMAPLMPTVVGGPIAGYTVAPALPSGLVINATSGAISGTPLAALGATDFVVTGTYSGGATTARLTITVKEVVLPTTGPFTVLMNQGIQMPDGSVPLVAGRTMFFQVFMNEASIQGLPVRAELWNGVNKVATSDGTMPGTMTTSPVNLKVPGTSVVSGYTYHVSVGSTSVTGTISALTVPKVPTTIVPITCGTTSETMTGVVNREALERSFLRVYPVPDDLDIQYTDAMLVRAVNEPTTPGGLHTYLEPNCPINPLNEDLDKILKFLDSKRIDANDGRYYLGVWMISDAALLESYKDANGDYHSLRGIGGLCMGKTSIMRSNGNMEVNFPHEFGHAFGLTDISLSHQFPYPTLEVFGYCIDIVDPLPGETHLISDRSNIDVMDPRRGADVGKLFDLMAYKNPVWVSDFHYKYLINELNKTIH